MTARAPRIRVQRRPVHGVLLLDKPLGLSSNEALPILEMLRCPANLYSKWPSDFPQRINRLFAVADRPPSPIRTAMLRTGLQHILFELLDRNVPETAPAYQLRVRKVIMWLETHAGDSPPVERLACEAGLSPGGLWKRRQATPASASRAWVWAVKT